ncbi:hypothetical protein [Aureimonas mangrovi]|uniref:hypothetical protein n=1 Tax=Aureimonas mangrovi TaxID=2758041 RepID=UPI001FE400D6|nr:hypothetical protein [Aureimonas mangrovi]
MSKKQMSAGIVVIADDEVFGPVETLEVALGPGFRAVREVAEMVDGILGADDRVPARDQGCVHLADVRVGPGAQIDDAFMPEVRVRNEKCPRLAHVGLRRRRLSGRCRIARQYESHDPPD